MIARLSRSRAAKPQARGPSDSGPLQPPPLLILLPVPRLDLAIVLEAAPDLARLVAAGVVEEIKGAGKTERRLAPIAVGERYVGSAVDRLGLVGKQDRLSFAILPTVRQEGIA